MKESYENIKLLLEKIPHEKYNWNICEDIRSLLSCLVCSLVKQSFVAVWVSGTVGTESTITLKMVSTRIAHSRTEKCSKYSHNKHPKKKCIYLLRAQNLD